MGIGDLTLRLLITAKDISGSVLERFRRTIQFLDSEISVIAGKIRESFSNLFGGGIDSAIDFEAALARVRAKADGSEADLAKLRAAAKAAANELGLGADGATRAAQALEFLTGAGLDVNQAIAALPATLRIAKNENISTEQSARDLTDVLSVMGLAFTDSGRAADVLQKSADLTSTSVSALAEAVRNGGGEAVKYGYTFEQTVTILTAFAKAGLQGSNAGTALKAVLRDIADPTSKARQEMAKFGESTGNVEQFIGKLVALGPRGLQVVRAFSDEAGPGLAALLRQGTAGLQAYGKALNQDAIGSLEKASNTINATARGALDRLSSAWAQVKLTLSEPLLKPIADGADALKSKLDELQASGVLEKIGTGIAELFTDAGKVVSEFLGKVDWASLKDEAGKAIASIRAEVNEAFYDVQGKIQTVSDWFAVLTFSPLMQAIDSYRLHLANVNQDQAEAVRLQTQIEARTAAIGRALSGTSAEYAKAGQAAKALAQNAEEAAQSNLALAGRVVALQRAVDEQQAAVDRLAEANAKGEASTEEYGQAVLDLWTLQEQLKAARIEQKSAQDALNDGTRQAVELGRLQAIELGKVETSTTQAVSASRQYRDALGEIDRQIRAASDNAGEWREGLKLTGVQLSGLKESAAAYAEKLALVEEAQRNGLATDKEVSAVKQAANNAQDLYNQALDEYVVQQERAVAAIQRANDLDQKSYDLKIRKQQAEIDLARVKSDAIAAEQAEAEIVNLLIEQSDKNIANKQREIEAYQQSIEAVRQRLSADGELNAADQDQLAIMEDKLKSLDLEKQSLKATADGIRDKANAERENAKAVEVAKAAAEASAKAAAEAAAQTQAAGNVFTSTLQGWEQRLSALSDAAYNAFLGKRGAVTGMRETVDAADQAGAALDALGRTLSGGLGTGIARELNDIAVEAQEVEARFWGQVAAAERLTEQLQATADGGKVNMNALAQATRGVSGEFDLLDSQRLDQLRSAIGAANDKLREMQAEAGNARDEIA
ncbi:MAG: phage tail tape measure protein, partial [Novosphingobium sp.]|nr:phage tail tape measure protein [Novosphingobium sp.]